MNHFASVTKYYSYGQYLELTETLVAEEKTTGYDQTPSKVSYTRLNLQRMKRWDKTLQLSEELIKTAKSTMRQTWWIFAEAWCGDGAQNIPVLEKIAEASEGRIELRILLRDEHHDIMDHYLTDGARSIPKLVALDEDGHELFTWGARPRPAQHLMMNWKANPGKKNAEEIKLDLHLWYAKDRGKHLQKEILVALKSLNPVRLLQ